MVKASPISFSYSRLVSLRFRDAWAVVVPMILHVGEGRRVF